MSIEEFASSLNNEQLLSLRVLLAADRASELQEVVEFTIDLRGLFKDEDDAPA